jgi:transcriptional regulator with XRE-family HTH domain
MDVTPDQLRAARALLRLQQSDLAQRARVSVVTIRRLEALGGQAVASPQTLNIVRAALEKAGAEFIQGGVRRRAAVAADAAALFDDLRAISLRSAARLEGQETLTDRDLYDEDGLPG